MMRDILKNASQQCPLKSHIFTLHSSEIPRGLMLDEMTSKTLQNLPYFLAKFEAFWRIILSMVNLKFLHSDYKSYSIQRCATNLQLVFFCERLDIVSHHPKFI